MFSEKLEDLLREEIELAVEDKQIEINSLKVSIAYLREEIAATRKENNDLNQNISNQKENESISALLKPLLGEENLMEFLSSLGLESNDLDVSHSDIPLWFKAVTKYYESRKMVYPIMDYAGIEYPYWAKNFKMPYDYNEEELDIFFDHLANFYVSNGNNFKHNMQWFWRDVSLYEGSTIDMLNDKKKQQYVAVPWNLLLKNKLLSTEKYLNKILSHLSAAHSTSHVLYFLKIQDYQELSEDVAKQLLKTAAKSSRVNKKDLSTLARQNSHLLKGDIDLAKEFDRLISFSDYSDIHYSKFPMEMQIEFLKNNLHNETYYKNRAVEIIGKLECSKEEKVELMTHFMNSLLESE